MIQAIPQLIAINYTPRADQGSDNPTTFKLRPLDGLQYMEVMHELTESKGSGVRISAAGKLLALKYGLADWNNFNDAQGNAIPFSPVNFKLIPPVILNELAIEIMNRSEFGEGDQKN